VFGDSTEITIVMQHGHAMPDGRQRDDEVDRSRTLMLTGCRERRLQDPRTVENIIGLSDKRERREQDPPPLTAGLTPTTARRTSISTAWQIPTWPRSINASQLAGACLRTIADVSAR
jgi:hypothetical protein